MTPQHRPDATADLTAALLDRVLVLDGAMGTMIQSYGLAEADYRGERFADHPSEQQGNNDLLSLSRPEIIREIHHAYLEAGADLLETNTFNAQRISLADYGMEDLAYELNVAAASLARAECDAMTERTPDRPRWVLGAIGPTNRTASISPDVNDPGARNVDLRRARRGVPGAGPRSRRRRGRRAPRRDDLRHAQRQGRHLRPRDALRGAGPPLAGDDLGHDHRRVRSHPLRTGDRGVLVLGAARPPARRRAELCAGSG